MELSFVDICIFQAIARPEVNSQTRLVKKVFFKAMNMDFAFEALRKLAIFRHGGVELSAGGDKWLHEACR